MIRWLNPLFVSQNAESDQERTMRRINRRRGLLDVYVLMLPANKEDQLEIIHANYLLQPWYRHRDLTIVGIAKGKGEAEDLLIRLVDESIKATGGPNIRRYLEGLLVGEGAVSG